ncbi:MAG TPA: MBL fold metallo-hydrolase [Candidatus Sulfotelmatobacter sp.]|nr:MBL fold metallo-hydrolase [Candidatus Sulfotelmatobacter sp.]
MKPVTIGAATVTRIEESYEPNFSAAAFFPDWRPEIVDAHRDWMVPAHYDPASDFLKLSVHSWLIKLDGRTILVDTCVGNHKERPARPKWHRMETRYLQRLADAGVKPDEIDLVMCTHLHVDHVGWNTRLDNGRWVPTFPKARYVFSQADYDYYAALDRDPEKGPANHGSFRDSVLPVVDAGLADIVGGAHALDEHLSIEPAPGHTPGSIAIKLTSRGAGAVFSGDILHHAIQLSHPEWNSFVCADAADARKSRRQVLEHCAGSGALLMPAHFGAPFVCHVEEKGKAFAPRFV